MGNQCLSLWTLKSSQSQKLPKFLQFLGKNVELRSIDFRRHVSFSRWRRWKDNSESKSRRLKEGPLGSWMSFKRERLWKGFNQIFSTVNWCRSGRGSWTSVWWWWCTFCGNGVTNLDTVGSFAQSCYCFCGCFVRTTEDWSPAIRDTPCLVTWFWSFGLRMRTFDHRHQNVWAIFNDVAEATSSCSYSVFWDQSFSIWQWRTRSLHSECSAASVHSRS